MPKQAGGTPPVPGEGECPYDIDLTETEYHVIEVLRAGRKREQSWELYFQWEAADLLQNMVEGVQKGITPEALLNDGYCDPDQFEPLYTAAVAVARCIREISAPKIARRSEGAKTNA